MVDYNLYGLNYRDFEHIVQALLKKHVAKGVRPFGDGKDGGREATYLGKMDYPAKSDRWNGYLVVQCKFCINPKSDPKKDGEWVLSEIKKEINKYLLEKKYKKKPEYYLFVTNVRLTAAPKTGSKDKANEILADYAQKLNLKGFDIWSYDELCRFIDDNESIRKAYAGFITTGDVLSEMMRLLGSDISADFYEVMGSFLQKELVYEQFAKLESAGKIYDQQIALPKVFVDLPVTDQLDRVSENMQKNNINFIERMVEIASLKLNKLMHDGYDKFQTMNPITYDHACYVLVGGPGQGKSTLAQFICQIYRRSILNDYPAGRIAPQATHALKMLNDCISGFQYYSKINKRFPFLIPLNRYASQLSVSPELSILEYIRKEVSTLGSSEIGIKDVKTWLKNYPWIVVFDGLDEVPASSNRIEVLRNIEAFRIDSANLNADILMIATTRPQNYNDELNCSYYKHYYLRPLSTKYALVYGKRLAKARAAGDERRESNIIRRLESACNNESTARLMESPLQITIMATLVERIGEPPRQRYRLFELYYRTIYEREIGREGALSAILSDRQTDIDSIHFRTGLLLQCRSELAGGTDSQLTDLEFEKIVDHRLAEVGESGENKKNLLSKIADGTLERLVFLVRPQDDKVAFEIRSLQEFMASEALLKGDEKSVKKRLFEIALISHWRNVFLFAVGKCFAELEHLLDGIFFMCIELNDSSYSKLTEKVLCGSKLSLDILLEGIAQPNPRYERQHALNALKLMELNDKPTIIKLASIYHERIKDLYQKEILNNLHQKMRLKKEGALKLLKYIADNEIQWAKDLIHKYWPENKDDQIELLSCSVDQYRRGIFIKNWSLGKYIETIPYCKADHFCTFRDVNIDKAVEEISDIPAWLPVSFRIQHLFYPMMFVTCLNKEGKPTIRIGMPLISRMKKIDEIEKLESLPLKNSSWAKYIATARFLKEPSYKSLSDALKYIAEHYPKDKRYQTTVWPIDACVIFSKSPKDLLELSELAKTKESVLKNSFTH